MGFLCAYQNLPNSYKCMTVGCSDNVKIHRRELATEAFTVNCNEGAVQTCIKAFF